MAAMTVTPWKRRAQRSEPPLHRQKRQRASLDIELERVMDARPSDEWELQFDMDDEDGDEDKQPQPASQSLADLAAAPPQMLAQA